MASVAAHSGHIRAARAGDTLAKGPDAAYMHGMENAAHPTGISFMKMHGAGNDFVIIDSRGRDAVVTAALARAVGDRHRGVGFDQLAEIRSTDQADFALDFWNSDGSRAGACGNATRCVCDVVMRETGRDTVTLTTERGLLRAVRSGDGRVSVNMGHPQRDWAEVPLARAVDTLHLPLPGDPVAVGMGNPHCVFFVPDAEAVDLRAIGPGLEHDPLFPARTNVEFASLLGPDRLRMRVWERGAGLTQACGTGACASLVAAVRRGLAERKARVIQPGGGVLTIEWQPDNHVLMTGDWAESFTGEWPHYD